MWLSGPSRIGQLARFCAVGLTCYVTNIVLLAALCELAGLHYLVAFVIVFFVSGALGYWLNKRFTFALRSSPDNAAILRYLIVNCVMFALGMAILRVLVEGLHVWYLAAATIVAGINAPLSFVIHRIVTYRLIT